MGYRGVAPWFFYLLVSTTRSNFFFVSMKFVTFGVCAAFILGQTGAVVVKNRCQIAIDTTFQDIEPTCGVLIENGLETIFPDLSNIKNSLDALCSSDCIDAVRQGVTEMIDQCEDFPQTQWFLKTSYPSTFDPCLKDGDEYCMFKFEGSLYFKSLDPLDPASIEHCSPCLKKEVELREDWYEKIKPSVVPKNNAAVLRGRELLDQCPEAMLNAPSDLKHPSIPDLE